MSPSTSPPPPPDPPANPDRASEWDAALPFRHLVGPGGCVVWYSPNKPPVTSGATFSAQSSDPVDTLTALAFLSASYDSLVMATARNLDIELGAFRDMIGITRETLLSSGTAVGTCRSVRIPDPPPPE